MSFYHAIDGNLSNSEDLKKVYSTAELSQEAPYNSGWLCYNNRRSTRMNRCVSSKPALIILLWTFVMSITYECFAKELIWNKIAKDPKRSLLIHAAVTLLLCVCPLAGFWADVKIGSYKMITRSMCVIVIAIIPAILLFVVHLTVKDISTVYIFTLVLFVVLSCIVGLAIVSFQANIIQFGIDQLQDSPSNHQSLFIYWFIWTWQLGVCALWITSMTTDMISHRLSRNWEKKLLSNIIVVAAIMFLLTASVCMAIKGKKHFFINSMRLNPYKLVYRATKFACQHKVPIRRSAFTYCEDTIPSGLDLGKTKYGGPFTTEQVEDVKVLYGILTVLLAIAPAFLMNIGNNHIISLFNHTDKNQTYNVHKVQSTLLDNGLLSSLLMLITIPAYICILRPYVCDYIPGMLTRVGLGVFFITATGASMLAIDTAEYWNDRNETFCFLRQSDDITLPNNIKEKSFTLIIPRTLLSVSNLFLYIALYEFICSQSPHSMKGMLIGLSFALKGAFELMGIVIVMVFVNFSPQSFPSCGMAYYILNVLWGVISLVIFIHSSRKYKYRVRDEFCNVYRYAEEYYSKEGEHNARTYLKNTI